jgi:hypothetical protein
VLHTAPSRPASWPLVPLLLDELLLVLEPELPPLLDALLALEPELPPLLDVLLPPLLLLLLPPPLLLLLEPPLSGPPRNSADEPPHAATIARIGIAALARTLGAMVRLR